MLGNIDHDVGYYNYCVYMPVVALEFIRVMFGHCSISLGRCGYMN